MIRINADDFGYSLEDNECILSCFKLGYIQSTSIMVNAPHFKDAVTLAKKNNFETSVGLHLNLTEFSPTTESIKASNRYFKNGVFSFKRKGIMLRLPRSDLLLIEEEIDNQMKIFRKHFPRSVLLDSHHHIHTVPAILNIVLKLAQQYGFQKIRISKNVGVKNPIKLLGKHFMNKKIRRYFPNSPSLFSYPNKEDIVKLLKVRHENCEIMVHPCLEDGVIRDKYSHLELDAIKGMVHGQ